MPARVRLPTVGAVDTLSVFNGFDSRYPCWLALAGIPLLTGVSWTTRHISGWTLANVESMTPCSVLRCPRPEAGAYLIRGSNMEPPVCAEHLESLESGARWKLTVGEGVPDEHGKQPLQLTLLMEDDLPPELLAWDGSWSIGDQQGLDVTLQIGNQEVSFWAPELAVRRLSSFLAAPAPTPRT